MHAIVRQSQELARISIAAARTALGWLKQSAPRAAQSMVEYAIIAAIVAVVAVLAVRGLGSSVTNAFNSASSAVDKAGEQQQP
jgi:Flp pilus assembly pilin Flp